jgi:hypothetical protein
LDEGEQQRKAATKRANAIFCMQSAWTALWQSRGTTQVYDTII